MLYEALVEEIKRKAFIAKSMGQEFTDENYLEEIEKSMGRAQMGEVRTWGGKEYVKTPKGWRPKPKGYKSGEKKGAGKNEKREYALMDINEAKKELVGKKITFKEYFFDGRGGYKDGEGEIKNVRLYGKEKQPIAEIDFPNGDSITISLDQLDKRWAADYKIEFDDNQPKGYKENEKKDESLVDMINRKLREGHNSVKDDMHEDAKRIVGGDKNRGKDSKALKKEISSDVKKLNEMSDRLEDLEDLMYGDEDDEMGTLENQSEYGDEYEELDGKFQKLAKNLKTSIRKYMKDINPDWKEPADADVWDFIREFNKAKARKSQG